MKWNRCMSRNLLAGVLAGGLLFLPSGCGFFENGGTVSGTVRYKGQPLSEGSVNFVNEKGQVVTAPIDQSGRYAATHVPVGSAKVTVQVLRADAPPISFGGTPKPVQGTATTLNVPLRYCVPATSGLRCDVTKGKQQFDIDLKE